MNFTTKHIVRAHQKASCKAILQELRFVELFGCLPSSHDRLNENVYGRGSMLQCPSGALLHIQSVQLGHRPHSDEPCLLSEDEESAKANKHAMLVAQKKEPLHNFQCSSGDVKSEVQSLCNGLNTCDILSKLSRLYQSSECPYRRTLFVNYTCLPAYSQTELICADSYVEITCATHGTAFKLLILEAKSLHNMSVEPQVSHLVGKNQCTRTDSSAQCINQDVTWFYSSLCTRQTVCTVNPNMVLKELEKNSFQKDSPTLAASQRIEVESSTADSEQVQCSKSSLYLEYTCAHEVLLKPSEVSPVRTVKKKPEKKAKKHETRDFVIDQVQDDSYKNWATEKGIKPGKEIPFVGPADDAQMKQKETSFQIGANAGQQAEKPMTDADFSYVLLASLIPSVLCLLLVITLIGYVGHQKRIYQLKHAPHQHNKHCTPCQQRVPRIALTVASTPVVVNNDTFKADSPCLNKTNCKTSVHANCTKLGTSLPHYWNPVAVNEQDAGDISIPGSSCHGCSETACSPMCENIHRIYNALPQSCNAHSSSSTGNSPKSTSMYLTRTDMRLGENEAKQPEKLRGSERDVTHTCLSNSESETSNSNKQPLVDCRQFSHHIPTACYLQHFGQTRAPLSLKSCSLCETSEAPKNSQAWPVEKQAVRSIASTVLNAPSVVATNSESPVFEGTTLLSTPGNLSMQVGSPLTESRNATSLRQSEMRFRVPPPLFTHMDKSPFSFSGHLILSSKPNNKLNNKAIRRVPVVRYPHEVEENSDEDKLSVVEEPKEDMITLGTQHTQAPLKYNRPDLCPSVNESEELKHKRSKTVSTWKQLNESCYGTGYLSAVETTGEAYTRETFAQCTPSTPLLSYRAFPDRLGTKFTGFKTPMNENNRDTAISSEMSSSSIIFPSGKPRLTWNPADSLVCDVSSAILFQVEHKVDGNSGTVPT
ncbi:hypothetical protein CSKR_104231 [Clonorchis sinensis]|uniref:Uncharacterized protein n=1 Tax=Clonorchis sinensis TaxID=79923 RepID=A0A8T1M5V4_CLOSI|nr:hypothetical protein CSKR_104231 [Clonorchis sinensis]